MIVTITFISIVFWCKSVIKYNIVHIFKHTTLKLNVKSSEYTDLHNDSKEIVS